MVDFQQYTINSYVSMDPDDLSTKSHDGPGWRSRCSDSVQAGRSGDLIPVGVRFSAAVQICPGAHSASCTVGTGYLSRW